MDQEQRNTEGLVETMLAGLADELNAVAPPNAAVLERVKTAVRHELNEQWFDRQPAPQPAPQALVRVKRAVHRMLLSEANRPGETADSLRMQRRAGLAAAAMIALCLGLIWQVGNPRQAGPQPSLILAAAQEHVDLFVDAARASLAGDEFSESILSELESIDNQLAGTSGEDADDAVLDDIGGAIEEFLQDSEPSDGKAGSGSWRLNSMG